MTDLDMGTVVAALNGLITGLGDREAAFTAAAGRTVTPALRRAFEELSAERRRFRDDLRAEVERLGGKPDSPGSVPGAVRRGLADIESRIRSEATPAVQECHLGEYLALSEYEKLLGGVLPAGLGEVLEEQRERTASALDFLRNLAREDFQFVPSDVDRP